jgi:hypothetical protein
VLESTAVLQSPALPLSGGMSGSVWMQACKKWHWLFHKYDLERVFRGRLPPRTKTVPRLSTVHLHGPQSSLRHVRQSAVLASDECVCVLRVYGMWHADGARVGDAQQTRRGQARSSTRKSGVWPQHPRPSVKAPASPCSGSSEPSGCVCANGLRGHGPRTWHACETRERRERGPTQRSSTKPASARPAGPSMQVCVRD